MNSFQHSPNRQKVAYYVVKYSTVSEPGKDSDRAASGPTDDYLASVCPCDLGYERSSTIWGTG